MSGSEDIVKQFSGQIPGMATGQNSVAKTYVDDNLAIRDADILTATGAAANAQATANTGVAAAGAAQSTANSAVGLANTAQSDITGHKASVAAHSAANITYSGPVEGATNTKQAIDLVKKRVDTIVAGAGASNTEILDARQPATGDPFPLLGKRLNNFDAQLADIAQRGISVKHPPQGFIPAIGDGVWNDTNAFLNLGNYCIANNVPMFVPPGTYIIDSNKLIFTLSEGQSLIILGLQNQSIIKRKNNSITADFQELIDISTDGTGNAESVQIRNLTIDSNASNNMPPGGASSFEWEHCADIRITGKLGSVIKSVSLDYIWFKDAVADHVYFAGSSNCYVERADISHIYATGRTRKRSDITITGGMVSCNVSDCDLQKFEVELNMPYDGLQPMLLKITNMNCSTIFDVIGKNLFLQVDNLTAYDLSIRLIKGIMANSNIYIPKTPNGTSSFLRYLSEHFEFVNTKFTIQPQDDGTIRGLKFQADTTYGNDVKIKNCRFKIDATEDVLFPGAAVESVRVISGATSTILVEDCWFDERFGHSVFFDRLNGTVVLRNNDYAGRVSAIRLNSFGTEATTLVIDSGTYQRVPSNKLFQISNIETLSLIIQRLEIPESLMGFVNDSGSPSSWAPLSFSNNKVVFVSTTPIGGGFKGDRAILTNQILGSACEWICTVTHPTTATWVMTKQFGIKKNTSANRPLPSLIDVGLVYQDTTLNANGKPIQWTGTAWVDNTGTVV